MKYVVKICMGVSFFIVGTGCCSVSVTSRQKNSGQTKCVPDHSLFCKKVSDAGSKSARVDHTKPSYGPSGATMRQTVISGGYMSGGHFSSSMGAGATRGHGHR